MLTKWAFGQSGNPGSEDGLILGGLDGRVLSIRVDGNNVMFSEECDGYFDITMTKADAIQALYEAIEWIKAQ